MTETQPPFEPDYILPEYVSLTIIVEGLASGRKVKHVYPKVRNPVTHVEPHYAEEAPGREWWFANTIVDYGVEIRFDAEVGPEGYAYITDRTEAGDE